MRPILAFDTSGAHCAAAIVWPSGARKPTCAVDVMAKGQAEALLPMIEQLLHAQGLVWADLAAIGVGVGPGNFTGIRISVALARGLALGLGVAAIGVSSFDARALGCDLADFWVTIPAPRGQFYAQRFGQNAPAMLRDAPPLGAPVLAVDGFDAADLVLNIAGIAAHRLGGQNPAPAPFYLRPADAAPPSDLPPAILP